MKKSAIVRIIFLLMVICSGSISASALSLNLDSIASMGKFPKFCIDVYRWGDGFFNGYDTTYVVGTGYKFNTKVHADSWIDSYNFYLPDRVRMQMHSEPSTTLGVTLGYMAVSVGYTKDISHLLGNAQQKGKEQYSFGFNCSLFTFNMAFVANSNGMKINKFGKPGNTFDPDMIFDGMKQREFSLETYYFFNHKKYSQAAAFNFSRVQTRSEGSWFAGVGYSTQTFDFDFNSLPEYLKSALPADWTDFTYHANTKNVLLKVGYGYNWVFAPKWVLGLSESPMLGLKIGTLNEPGRKRTAPTFSNQLRMSVVWNHKQWFAGAIGTYNTALFYDKKTVFQNSGINGIVVAGYRFNLW